MLSWVHLANIKSQTWRKHTVSSNWTASQEKEYFIGMQKYAESKKVKFMAFSQRFSDMQKSMEIRPITKGAGNQFIESNRKLTRTLELAVKDIKGYYDSSQCSKS